MLKFLKSIFEKKEIEKEEISLEKLEEWFSSKSGIIFNDLDKKIGEIKSKISQEIKKCSENLEILENTGLKNPNIPVRAKQAMEGNRAAYIKRVKIFLDNINLDNKNHNEIIDFCGNFGVELNNFAKSTLKSYQILQEFLANESSNVAMNIKNLDSSVKELKNSIEKSKISDIEKVKIQISDLKFKIKRKSNLKEELDAKEEHAKGLKKSKENMQQEIDAFRKSEAFIGFQNLKKEKELVKKDISAHEDILLSSFSVLEKAFKKFSRIVFEDEKLVKNYAESPIKALTGDKELKIMDILGNLEKNLLDNKLELDEKKNIKSLNEIKKLDKDFFMNFLKKYYGLKESLGKIKEKLENNETENKDTELNNKLNSLNSEIEKLENNLTDLRQEFEKINIKGLKTDLQEKINNLLNKNIIIS